MQRRLEFSFPGGSPRPQEEEEVRWLQASRQASPDYYYHHSSSSGTPSPPLWRDHREHQVRQYPASAGSSPPPPSSSRAQAIAGYRREMLDLVRGLPESAYELSLRDIVEHHHHNPTSPASIPLPTPPPPPPAPPPARGHEPANAAAAVEQQSKAKQGSAVRRQRSRSMERSVSLDTGRLIKFFMPLSIHGRRKKKVSPKPDAKDASKKKQQGTKNKEQDEEWRTKNDFSEASAGTSSTRTSSTGSTNSTGSTASGTNGSTDHRRAAPVRTRSRKRNGCYAFFRSHKSKNGDSQD